MNFKRGDNVSFSQNFKSVLCGTKGQIVNIQGSELLVAIKGQPVLCDISYEEACQVLKVSN